MPARWYEPCQSYLQNNDDDPEGDPAWWRALWHDEQGQDLIEYALLAGLISLSSVLMVLNVGNGVSDVWDGVDDTMGQVPSS